MTRLQAGILETRRRMDFAEQQWCQTAKREGWKILARGKYYPTGPELIQFDVPQKHAKDFPYHAVFASTYDNA